ncbi:MAG: hypothetical protein NC543_07885 [bacterium]|nr:hypothetical protein [bacterium]MCM1373498.1 hypothetical protein [Muribaculum sp.]
MSNYSLKAEVSRLQSRLRDIENENRKLRSEINATVRSVNEAERNLSDYNQQVRNALESANGSIKSSIDHALSAYELQGQIDQLYTRFKSVELANKKIRTLNNKKYYDFNNYRTVRKIVQGLMDNLDLSLVSDQVIYKSIERQHLQTPDFWLTPVLISIMAWKNDDKQLADRAMETACRLDMKNSSIFYMIFNMRMERDEAAVKWFLEYQKCSLKGSDENTFLMLFSLISRTLSDNVDEETSRMISDYIHRIIVECAEQAGYSESDVIGIIQGKMLALLKAMPQELPALAKYCSDYGTIATMLNLAGNNYNILEFILRVVNVPVAERNTYLKEYLNELLAKPNEVEIETYDEIEYNELVIRLSGDVEQARELYDREQLRRRSDFNIISSMVQWIYDFGNDDVNGQMRLNMFTLIKTLQEKAAEAYFAKYRSMYREVHPVQILDYQTDVDFTQEAGELGKAESFYQDQQKQELSAVKNTMAFVAFGLGIACGVAAPFVHLALFAGLGIGAAVGIGILISNRYKRRNIMLRIQKQKENVLEILRRLFADFAKLRAIYQEYDGISARIMEEYAKL